MKKRSLKASFVITFAGSAAALAAPACSSGYTGNPPAPEVTCLDVAPNSGAPCSDPGLACVSADPCGSEVTYTCSADGVWTADYTVSCNPPPVLVCPDTIPMHGDPTCFGEGTCNYTDECGLAVTASCSAGAWEVNTQGICTPPPPCDSFGTADQCGMAGYCRWLTPGCGDPDGIPALPAAGCHPLEACVDGMSCPAGSACEQVMVTPSCVDEGCDACGVATSVCL
jgi:hypothetical protein